MLRRYYVKIADIEYAFKNIKDLNYVLITINKNTKEKQTKLFFCDKIPQHCDDNFDVKKIKK
jgi:hypothetical protein